MKHFWIKDGEHSSEHKMFPLPISLPGVTILLSLTIFLNTVSAIIPITSDSPLIGNYNMRRRHLRVCFTTVLRIIINNTPFKNWPAEGILWNACNADKNIFPDMVEFSTRCNSYPSDPSFVSGLLFSQSWPFVSLLVFFQALQLC